MPLAYEIKPMDSVINGRVFATFLGYLVMLYFSRFFLFAVLFKSLILPSFLLPFHCL